MTELAHRQPQTGPVVWALSTGEDYDGGHVLPPAHHRRTDHLTRHTTGADSPMTNQQIDEIRTRLASPDLDAAELREIAVQLLADNDAQHMEADYWRESYRLTKGLTNDEIGAMTAVRDATRIHPHPCRFPHETCLCDD